MTPQTTLTIVPDSLMRSVEPDGFYQTPNSMTIKAIRAKLTAADWALWSYLQMIDPFGDRMIELPKIPEIAEVIGVSSRQVKRSLSRLEDLGLYSWEPVIIRGQNLAGKQAKELCQKKRINKYSEKRKMTDLSEPGQSCPEDDEIIQNVTNFSSPGQDCPNQKPEALSDNSSSASQTIQTYSDFIQTLSEEERGNFLNFCREEAKNLPQQVNDIEAWLANKNKAEKNRWEVYYQRFQLRTEQSETQGKILLEFRRELAEQERRNTELMKQQMPKQAEKRKTSTLIVENHD